MVVQHNLTALNSNRMLGITTNAQAKSTEKLSSGYKINRAADDAAGLSISEKMRKQIRGLTQASSNAQDGISAVQTAEGALNEVQDMLQRMNELAVKASNGTMSEDDRSYIQDEIDQLVTEIDRVSETTKFNETYMLKGGTDSGDTSYSYITTDAGIAAKDGGKIYASDGSVVTSFTEDSIDDAVNSGNYFSAKAGDTAGGTVGDDVTNTVNSIVSMSSADGSLTYSGDDRLYDANGEEIAEASLATYLTAAETVTSNGYDKLTIAQVYYTSIKGITAATDSDFKEVSASTAKLYDKDGKEIAEGSLKDYVDEDGNYKLTDLYTATDGATTLTAASVDEYIKSEQKTGILKFTLQVGADTTDDNKISVEIESMGAENLGVDDLKVDGKDSTNADAAVGVIEKAIQKVSTQRSALGAVQNRLEHTINNLDNVVENTTSAESAIRDTDMATEMVKYSNNNILAQAGQAMLAQANQSNQGVLSLLG